MRMWYGFCLFRGREANADKSRRCRNPATDVGPLSEDASLDFRVLKNISPLIGEEEIGDGEPAELGMLLMLLL